MGHNSAVSGHPISTSFPQVDSWSTDPRVLRCHRFYGQFKGLFGAVFMPC